MLLVLPRSLAGLVGTSCWQYRPPHPSLLAPSTYRSLQRIASRILPSPARISSLFLAVLGCGSSWVRRVPPSTRGYAPSTPPPKPPSLSAQVPSSSALPACCKGCTPPLTTLRWAVWPASG